MIQEGVGDTSRSDGGGLKCVDDIGKIEKSLFYL